MTASINPSNVQVPETGGLCDKKFALTKQRLQKHAWLETTTFGKKNYEFVMVCIQIDSQWYDLAISLSPDFDCQEERAQGIDPLAIASVIGWSICGTIAFRCPSIAARALKIPPEGYVKAFVLTKEGGAVYNIKPEIDCDSN